MTVYTPSSVANQTFKLSPNGVTYNFSLRFFRDLMYVTIRNEDMAVYVGSLRCADRQWLLPWRRAGYGNGNFRFEDDNRQYPDFRNFGTSCRLVFYSAAEIAEAEGNA